jgi:hypothetical protein
MNGTTPCRALLEHLQQDHHQLNHELIAIGHELEELPERSAVPAHVIDRLRRLCARLEAHFHDEECRGRLEEAASRAPSASHQVRQIETEHRLLVPALQKIIDAAASPAPSASRVAKEFAQYVARIHAHEAAETQFMQYALGGEASDYDVEGNE